MKKVLLGLFCYFLSTISIHSGTIRVPLEQATIQTAIDSSFASDTILVSPGTYIETITYPSHRLIIKTSLGADSTFLEHPSGTDNLVTITNSGTGSSFEGFAIEGVSSGLSAIFVSNTSNFLIKNNTFVNLLVSESIKSDENASVIIKFNLFVNSAQSVVVNTQGSNCQIINNTIVGGKRGLAIFGSNSIIMNNIIAYSEIYGLAPPDSSTISDYNDFWNNNPDYFSTGYEGANDISLDPQFADRLNNDFNLLANSPCLDTGNPDSLYNNADGTRSNIGAFDCDLGDLDNDGVNDCYDLCLGYDDNIDSDSDGVADGCDICSGGDDKIDSDSDNIPDACDPCLNDPQNDIDGDGLCADVDNCPTDYNLNQNDEDSDGIGDVCDNCPLDPDNDIDNDSICGESDNCIDTPNSDQLDSDFDGIGNACDICPQDFDPNQFDSDNDGIGDSCDTCPDLYDPNQIDSDNDGVGDLCDVCPDSNDNIDTDSDGVPDGCDVCPEGNDNVDADGDNISDSCDNCPSLFNSNQNDFDNDGIGDVCDACIFDPNNDVDSDGICSNEDNCPTVYNPLQDDNNENGIGDLCEDCCIGSRGNANGDAQDLFDISDLVFIVAFAFHDGPEPFCIEEADFDGSSEIDVSDLVKFVAFVFLGGVPPTDCP